MKISKNIINNFLVKFNRKLQKKQAIQKISLQNPATYKQNLKKSVQEHRIPYAYGRPDFRPGNTFFKTSEIRSSGEKPTVFASLSFGIVAGNYLSGKPVDPLISALFRPGVYGYRQKEKAP